MVFSGANMVKIIGYVRVSTVKQKTSGLGLEAQVTAIQQYAQQIGGEIVAVYTETETGSNDARPEIAKAIAHARRVRKQSVTHS